MPYGEWIFSKLFENIKESILDDEFINFFGLNKNKLETIMKSNVQKNNKSNFLIWKMLQLSQWYFLVYK